MGEALIQQYVVFKQMACPPSKIKFQFRRDTLCNWSNSNPVLAVGEPAFESDTNSFKIGDGITKWNSLPYIQSPLVFTEKDNVRTLTGYKESGQILKVRSTNLIGDMLNINLASFNPSLGAQGLPSNSINWDVPCSGFSVSVTNPSDYTSEYINAVSNITTKTGIFSTLSKFTASRQSNTPGGGINWTQSFLTNSDAVIQPISTTIAGGGASCDIFFLEVGNTSNSCVTTLVGANGSIYTTPVLLDIKWDTPTTIIALARLSGKTFLETYFSTSYSASVTGISNSSNYSHNITSIGGQLSNTSGSGTMTFTIGIHKDNINIPRSASTLTTFNRPSSVTGTAYTTSLTASDIVNVTFIYPSFWLFTIGTPSPPTSANILSGSSFLSNVTLLGDRSNNINTFINNTTGSPKGFWFAVVSNAPQPSTFKSGISASLLSDVAVTLGNTISLAPVPMPIDYVPVSYILYGITLQNGSSYISIS